MSKYPYGRLRPCLENQRLMAGEVPQLLPGLTFDNATRTFTGIPTAVGTYLVDVVGSDGTSAETNSFTLPVEPGIAPITLTGTNQTYDGSPNGMLAGKFVPAIAAGQNHSDHSGWAGRSRERFSASSPQALRMFGIINTSYN